MPAVVPLRSQLPHAQRSLLPGWLVPPNNVRPCASASPCATAMRSPVMSVMIFHVVRVLDKCPLAPKADRLATAAVEKASQVGRGDLLGGWRYFPTMSVGERPQAAPAARSWACSCPRERFVVGAYKPRAGPRRRRHLMSGSPAAEAPDEDDGDGPLVAVLSANMGAGHLRVGCELARRLAGYGVRTRLVDLGELLPSGWGRGLTGFYKFMACHAQWLYETTFRVQMRTPPGSTPLLFPLDVLAERRLGALVEREHPALVLSTFHLSSQVAGRMRKSGMLSVPVVSLVLDFFVHGMWVHPGVDAHLLLHPSQVHQVEQRGGKTPVVCGPVVRQAFWAECPSWRREDARRTLGLGPAERCIVIVGGSWGVGQLPATFATLASDDRFVPVAVAGRNSKLFSLLEAARRRARRGKVLSWVDDMDRLMAAADATVENAGGLTAMEALARGVPVVTYRPIAGHGRANAEAMAAAGVSVYPRNPRELVTCLLELTSDTPLRRRLVAEGRSMFSRDPASLVSSWARAGNVLPELKQA